MKEKIYQISTCVNSICIYIYSVGHLLAAQLFVDAHLIVGYSVYVICKNIYWYLAQVQQRRMIEKKLEEDAEREKEHYRQETKLLIEESQLEQAKISRLQQKMELVNEVWRCLLSFNKEIHCPFKRKM